MTTIYISGPMTGLPDFNYPAFHAAARALREAGYTVVNPAENGLPADAPWSDHMREDIRQMMDCDGVAVLPGWQVSKGAKLETMVATAIGMRVRSLALWLDDGRCAGVWQ